MHEKKIAYRDLKPENLVFDERGYVKLVDLGLAKFIPAGKTWTICGTPDYIAPEIILHEGHNHAVDCWAIGILIYEMLTGTTPFADSDAMKVYQNILKHDIRIPNSFSKDVADIVKKLLHAQQSKRFGTLKGGLTACMKHKWLANFNFNELIAGKQKAPYVPKIAGKDDISNFGSFDDVADPVSVVFRGFLELLCLVLRMSARKTNRFIQPLHPCFP
jgi:serine/threonine protein kinase